LPADISPRYSLAPVESVALGAANIPALLVRPDTDEPCPAVLLQHGYAAQKSDLLPLAAYLAVFGFVALLPDAWEHGERCPDSGARWTAGMDADYFLDVVRHTTEDLRTALDWLEARPDVRADGIVIGGFSMGAMAALVVGTEDPRPAGVISASGSPLPDLASVARFEAQPPDEELRRWVPEHDAAAHVARLAPKPLLLQHGRHDDLVPLAGALRLYEAALPHYTAHPDRLALMLYDHSHTVSEEQVRDAVNWMAPFFVAAEEAA
jgi:dienelactone hydrolase